VTIYDSLYANQVKLLDGPATVNARAWVR